MIDHRPGCWCDTCLASATRKAAVALSSWSVLLVVLLLMVLSGCGPVPRPQPPSPPSSLQWQLTVRVVDAHTLAPIDVARATFHMSDPEVRVSIPLAAGVGTLRLPQRGYSVCGRAIGYQQDGERCVPVTLTSDQTATIALAKDPTVQPAPRLTAAGRWLRMEGGGRYRWRMATGFMLLDLLADGKTGEAEVFADWLQRVGFSGVRVLGTNHGWFNLSTPEAQVALPRLFDLLDARGLHVELTALAGTKAWTRVQAEAHVRMIGAACASEPACVVELANEGAHSTQNRDITNSPATLRQLRALVPPHVLTATASNCCGQSDEAEHYPGGDYITIHRDRGRDEWNAVRRVRELQAVSEIANKFVVDDEPIGAGEVDEPGRREANPSVFFANGVLCRVFEVGCTFHFSDGLFARVPGPVQQAAAEAFIAGTRIVPDDVVLAYKNASWHDSPVKDFDTSAAVRVYSGVSGARGITIALGLRGDPRIVWQNGWRVTAELARRPGVVVYAVEQ